MNVAVLGASDNPERYSYKAIKLLSEKGHRVYPVHPKLKSVLGIAVFERLSQIPDKINTLSVYVSPQISSGLETEIIAAAPARVIFNPGAENPALEEKLSQNGIKTLEACTLVLLTTGQF